MMSFIATATAEGLGCNDAASSPQQASAGSPPAHLAEAAAAADDAVAAQCHDITVEAAAAGSAFAFLSAEAANAPIIEASPESLVSGVPLEGNGEGAGSAFAFLSS